MGRRLEYTQEEKVAAIKLVTEGGRTIPSVANEYGIHENTLWKWKRQYTLIPDEMLAEARKPIGKTEEEKELERLKRRIRELEEENSFLKKCRHTLRKTRSKVCDYQARSGIDGH